jgi:competence protein ComEA
MAEIIVDGGVRGRLEELVGRRREVRVVALLVIVAGVVALVLWMRGAPATIAPPATSGAPFAPSTGTPAPEGGTVVHVGGAVKRAGIFELEPGARVADALELAVPRPNADLDALNLAELVSDGAKIDVPRRGEAVDSAQGSAPSTSTSTSTESPGTLVNVNTADEALLDTIPEVGPATAQAIIEYRTQIGTFTSVEQLIDVTGIGPATLEAMRPFVTV